MRPFSRRFVAFIAAAVVASLSSSRVFAGDSAGKTATKRSRANSEQTKANLSRGTAEQDPPEVNLLEAMRQGEISVQAEGMDDGRMKMSLTNRTRRPLRVVLPPGVIAQGATGQFGGMGGMGGGMGGMGGGMGGMGGGMGGMGGMGGGMGGMGGMGMGGGMGGGLMGGAAMPASMGLTTTG